MKIAQFYENDTIRLGIIEAEQLHPLRFEGDEIVIEMGGLAALSIPAGQP